MLLAAVAFVLVPQGIAYVREPAAAASYFFAGGLVFFAVEHGLGLRRRESPQFAATLLDYVPESLALGGAFAAGSPAAPLPVVNITSPGGVHLLARALAPGVRTIAGFHLRSSPGGGAGLIGSDPAVMHALIAARPIGSSTRPASRLAAERRRRSTTR